MNDYTGLTTNLRILTYLFFPRPMRNVQTRSPRGLNYKEGNLSEINSWEVIEIKPERMY